MAPFVLAVLGILGTLGGVLLGGWQGRRHEDRRWLRDKRLEAYSAMNTAISVWLKAYTHFRPNDGLPSLTAASGDLADKQQALRLLASPTTRDRAQDVLAVALAAYMGATTAASEQREITDEEADAVLDQLSTDGQRLFDEQMTDIHRRRPTS